MNRQKIGIIYAKLIAVEEEWRDIDIGVMVKQRYPYYCSFIFFWCSQKKGYFNKIYMFYICICSLTKINFKS